MTLAVEREKVVLAKAEEVYIAQDDHFVIILFEYGAANKFFDVLLVAACEETKRLFDSLRGLGETVTSGVLSEAEEKIMDKGSYGLWPCFAHSVSRYKVIRGERERKVEGKSAVPRGTFFAKSTLRSYSNLRRCEMISLLHLPFLSTRAHLSKNLLAPSALPISNLSLPS